MIPGVARYASSFGFLVFHTPSEALLHTGLIAEKGWAKCMALLGPEFERVFYKNDYSFGVTIFNLYMTYGKTSLLSDLISFANLTGGTNWGNLGHPGGYTR